MLSLQHVVRKKKNRSGITSIVVVDKRGGKLKEIHTVSIAHDDEYDRGGSESDRKAADVRLFLNCFRKIESAASHLQKLCG